MCNELKIGLVRAFNGKGKIAIVAKPSISGHEKTFQRSFKKNQICKKFPLRPKSVSKLETRKLFFFLIFWSHLFFYDFVFLLSPGKGSSSNLMAAGKTLLCPPKKNRSHSERVKNCCRHRSGTSTDARRLGPIL